MCFSRSNIILAISQEGLVRLMWNERKCISWILGIICDLDLWHHLWPWPYVSRSNFEIAVSQELLLVWCEMKRKRIDRILGWLRYMILPFAFDHTHDLDLGVSRSESWITLSQEWDGRLTWNEMNVSHPFMTMILTRVTMLGWADVPDSDRGDFKRRRAVDISSFENSQMHF